MNEIDEEHEWMGYVERLAYKTDPDYDDEGNMCGSCSLNHFIEHYDSLSFPLTRQQFLNNSEVIDTIEAYGMDVERFWRVVQYISYVNERKCVSVVVAFPPVQEQLLEAVDYYQQNRDVELTLKAKGKRKLTIFDPQALQVAFGAITKLLQEHPQDLQWAGVDFAQGKIAYPLSIQRCHVAKLFMALFELLDLPDGAKLQVRDGVSYNKLLLISRLIYAMRLTDTSSYLYDENALKANLRDYAEVEIRSFV